jgi:hypothetical protein
MKNVGRLGVIGALAMGASGGRTDQDPYSTNAQETEQARATDPSAQDSDRSLAEARAGAGSMEPQQATEGDPGTAAHQNWVESIWTSP